MPESRQAAVDAMPVTSPWAWVRWSILALTLVLAAAAVRWSRSAARDQAVRAASPTRVPVAAATARRGSMPVSLDAIGSVTAFNTVVVRSRVEGQLVRVAFREGELVRAGDVLAELDARPFAAQLAQAEGQRARDLAQLKNAQRTVARYHALLDEGIIPRYDYDDRVALAEQYAAAVRAGDGAVDDAKLRLEYARITAPVSGRVGLRLVDVGNLVRPADETGLVVITQVQPIAVSFTLPQDELPAVLAKLRSDQRLAVTAFDRAGGTRIAEGALESVDNQIDPTTGTVRLKAAFANDDGALFPNQFLNVRLQLEVRQDAVIVPTAAIQHGPPGTFVYAVRGDDMVEVRPVTLGPVATGEVVVEHGVAPGDVVVVDGVDRLRAGTTVQVTASPPGASTDGTTASSAGAAKPPT